MNERHFLYQSRLQKRFWEKARNLFRNSHQRGSGKNVSRTKKVD